jgi:Secretion system C-terminal sorting domain
MRHFINLLFIVSFIGQIYAQSATPNVIASCGGFTTAAVGSVSWTIGEIRTETGGSAAAGAIATQGFQQPEPKVTVGTDELDFLENFTLFPNPSADEVTIAFSAKIPVAVNWEIISEDGRTVLFCQKNERLSGDFSEKIDISELGAGSYFFILKNETQVIRATKILKI